MNRLKRLSPWFLLEAFRLWGILLLVDLRLMSQSWDELRLWITQNTPHSSEPTLRVTKRLEEWSRLLLSLSRWRLRKKVTCLAFALTLRQRARSAGLNPQLILGARRDLSGRIDAHAWLALGGYRLDPLAHSELFTAFQ